MIIESLANLIRTMEQKKVFTRVITLPDEDYYTRLTDDMVGLVLVPNGYIENYLKFNVKKYMKLNNHYIIEVGSKGDATVWTVSKNKIIDAYDFDEVEFARDFFKEDKVDNYYKEKALEDIQNLICKDLEEQRKIDETDLEVAIENKKSTLKRLIAHQEHIEMLKAKLVNTKVIDELKEKLTKEFELIIKHPKTKTVFVEQNSMTIKTNDLYITEDYTDRRYKIGQIEIKINIKSGTITFDSSNSQKRYGFWGLQTHPHVSNLGSACFGTFDTQIAQYLSDREYYAVYLTLLSFLGTVDIDDVAGFYLCAWDEVDEDGNVIRSGHAPEHGEYEGYGCEDDHFGYEENGYECAECGEFLDESEGQFLGDAFVCQTCLDNLYEICDICGEYVREDECYYDDDDTTYCEHCWNNREENAKNDCPF